MVEAAIVMILLIMVTIGIMSFGYLFMRAQVITSAARQGARIACVGGDWQTTVNTYLTSHGMAAGDITSASTPLFSQAQSGDPIKVTVTVKNLDVMHIGSASGATNGLIPTFWNSYTASVTMAKE